MGLLYTLDVDNNEKEIFSSNFSCPESGFTIDEIEPRIFSFNNPAGACDKCDGLGNAVAFDLNLVIPDKNISFSETVPLLLGRLIQVNFIFKH